MRPRPDARRRCFWSSQRPSKMLDVRSSRRLRSTTTSSTTSCRCAQAACAAGARPSLGRAIHTMSPISSARISQEMPRCVIASYNVVRCPDTSAPPPRTTTSRWSSTMWMVYESAGSTSKSVGAEGCARPATRARGERGGGAVLDSSRAGGPLSATAARGLRGCGAGMEDSGRGSTTGRDAAPTGLAGPSSASRLTDARRSERANMRRLGGGASGCDGDLRPHALLTESAGLDDGSAGRTAGSAGLELMTIGEDDVSVTEMRCGAGRRGERGAARGGVHDTMSSSDVRISTYMWHGPRPCSWVPCGARAALGAARGGI